MEEELATGDPAQIILDSPYSTIPFDYDSPPRHSPSERLLPSEKVSGAAGSPSLVIEIGNDKEDNHIRPRHRNIGCCLDYTYRDYQDTISAPPLRKRKRELSDAVDFRSKIVRDSCLNFLYWLTINKSDF